VFLFMKRIAWKTTVLAALLACIGTSRGGDPDDTAGRVRSLKRQLTDLDALARVRVLEGRGEMRRVPVNTAYNVEEFAPVTARFVRFSILATRDGSEPCLDALEIYGPDSADNLARAARGARVSASSFHPAHPIHRLAHLRDDEQGKPGAWVAGERGKGWAQVEFPAAVQISRVVWSRDADNRSHDRLPSAYRVEVSGDGSVWATVASGEDRAGPDPWMSRATLLRALNSGEQKRRQDLLGELKKLDPGTAVALRSGPQVGENVSGRFPTLFLNGEHAGKKRCPV
jgi:hypothetical protein